MDKEKLNKYWNFFGITTLFFVLMSFVAYGTNFLYFNANNISLAIFQYMFLALAITSLLFLLPVHYKLGKVEVNEKV